MEVLTIVLSGLLSLASGVGIIADSFAGRRIRSQIISIEEQQVRIDNSPSYSVAQGKLQKVRIATRGTRIQPDIRIEALELETDRVDLDLSRLDFAGIDELRTSLNRPFQGAVRLVVTEADLNRALESPKTLAQIQELLNRFIVSRAGSTNIAYQLLDLSLAFLPDNRLGIELRLARPVSRFETKLNSPSRELVMSVALGIEVSNSKTIRLVNPEGIVNNNPMSPRLLNGFAVGIGDQLNNELSSLEEDGILTRILQLEIDEDKMELASFFKLETKNP